LVEILAVDIFFIQILIKKIMRQFLVFGTQTCPWCNKAKELIESNGDSYFFVDINDEILYKNYYFPHTGGKKITTVPQIYWLHENQLDYVSGGFTGLHEYYNKNSPVELNDRSLNDRSEYQRIRPKLNTQRELLDNSGRQRVPQKSRGWFGF